MIRSRRHPVRLSIIDTYALSAAPNDPGYNITDEGKALIVEAGLVGDNGLNGGNVFYDCTSGDLCFENEAGLALFQAAMDARAEPAAPGRGM